MKNNKVFHEGLIAFIAVTLLVTAGCTQESAQMYGTVEAPPVEPAKVEQPPIPADELVDVEQPVIPPDQLLPPDTEVEPVIPKEKIEWITVDAGNILNTSKAATDILFVIDDSDSMKATQENLSRNIDRFVGAFAQKKIDFHIGVISVWDSSDRYAKAKKDSYGIGELRRLKNAKGKSSEKRFIYGYEGYAKDLAATLKIGVTPMAQGGPEVEEVFSPLSAALNKAGHGDVNEEFFKKREGSQEDAQLAVVIVTDADDSSSGISPEQMAQQLFDFKGGNKKKVSAYGVLVKKSDSDKVKDFGLKVHPNYHPECFDITEKKNSKGKIYVESKLNGKCTEGFGPDRIEQFIFAANADQGRPDDIRKKNILSLNQKDFGKDLAKIGSDIVTRALEKEVELDQRPRLDAKGTLMLRVRYGTADQLAEGSAQRIPQQRRGGWVYNPSNNSVIISGDVQYKAVKGGRFAVEMVPMPLKFGEEQAAPAEEAKPAAK